MTRQSERTARSDASDVRDKRRRLLEETIEREQQELLNDIVFYLFDFGVATDREGVAVCAREVLHETVATALSILDRYDPERPARLWLRGIAVKSILRLLRTQSRERRRLTLVADTLPARRATSKEKATKLSESELFDLLARPLDNTPSAQSPSATEILALVEGDDREILRLRYVEGLNGEELAARFGTSEGAAHQRLCRARNRLRRAFLNDDI